KIPQVIDAPRGCVIGRAHIDDGDSLDRELMRPVAVLELTVTPGIADAGSYAAAPQGHGAVGCSIVCNRGGRISLVPIRGGAEQSARRQRNGHVAHRITPPRKNLIGIRKRLNSAAASTNMRLKQTHILCLLPKGSPHHPPLGDRTHAPSLAACRHSKPSRSAAELIVLRGRTDLRASRRSHLESLAH